MKSEVSELSPTNVEVTVTVPWDRIEKELDAGFRKVAKTARVKGFRPGKVPPKMVRKIFKGQVQAEAQGNLIDEGIRAAVEEHEIAIVAQPELKEPGSIAEGEELKFAVTIEIRPELTEVKLEGIEVFDALDEVSDDAVDDRIEQLRKQQADLQEPEPMRPAKDGDQLLVDFTVKVDGEEKAEMASEERPVELGEEGLLKEWQEGLSGKSPGDTAEITVEFPEDHESEDLKGKTAVFSVTVKELRERVLPELDDEFAKDQGEYENLADFKKATREILETQAKNRSELAIKDQILKGIVEANEIPVPPSMVQQQKQQMMYEMMSLLQYGGGDVSKLLESVDERSEHRVKATIAMVSLAKIHDVKALDEDLEARFAKIAEETGKHIAKVKADFQGEQRERLENEIVEEKLMALIREKVTVKPGHPPEETSGDSDGD